MVKKNLSPTDGRKSFYGKAKAIDYENGTVKLQSYSTIVAKIEEGVFYRLWGGFSATTMRHVNAFIRKYDLPFPGGKKWWNELEVGKGVRYT